MPRFKPSLLVSFLITLVSSLAAEMGLSATVYVSPPGGTPAGNDAADGSATTPYATIQKAVKGSSGTITTIKVNTGTYAETENNKVLIAGHDGWNSNNSHITIEPWHTGDEVTIRSSKGAFSVLNNITALSSLTLNNLTIAATGDDVVYCDGNSRITLDSCNITVPAPYDVIGVRNTIASLPTRNLTITNCQITRSGSGVCIEAMGVAAGSGSNGLITFTGNTVTGGTGAIVRVQGECDNITIQRNTIEATAACSTASLFQNVDPDLPAKIMTSCPRILIDNNIASGLSTAVRVYGVNNCSVIITNNVFVVNSSTARVGVCIGQDAGVATGTFNAVHVDNNTVTANSVHAYLFGVGCDSGVITNNFGTGGNYQLVVKGRYNLFQNNIMKGAKTLCVRRGQYNVFEHNTFYATSGFCLGWDDNGENLQPIRNQYYYNIFDASGGATHCLTDHPLTINSNSVYGQRLDFNCYVSGTSGFGFFNESSRETMALFDAAAFGQSAWPANIHSITASPQFLSVDSNDFRVASSSPCVNRSGQILGINTFKTIGAWEPKLLTKLGDCDGDDHVTSTDLSVVLSNME